MRQHKVADQNSISFINIYTIMKNNKFINQLADDVIKENQHLKNEIINVLHAKSELAYEVKFKELGVDLYFVDNKLDTVVVYPPDV